MNFKDVRQALKQDDNDACLNLLADYIKETFLFDKIGIYFSDDSATNFQKLHLKCIASGAEDMISQYLEAIEACVNVSHKEFPPIFYAQSPETLVRLEYDDLLLQLAKNDDKSEVMPYLDAGNFLIFPGNEAIKEDFMFMAERNNPRRNYSPLTSVSNSILCDIKKFCEDHHLEMSTHCNYLILTMLVEGNNVVLCEQNIICSSHRTMMRRYDACGEPQLNDSVFLRDVPQPVLKNPNSMYSCCDEGLRPVIFKLERIEI